MTLHTIFKVRDAFLDMLGLDSGGLMLMAAVAGIAAVIVAFVAGGTWRLVITIEQEALVVVEGGRLPRLLVMALPAIARDLAMQVTRRLRVAGRAVVTQVAAKQQVREAFA